ncbi:serine hydrolase domain-containing protein [Embleya sp. NPDC005971]|uniref:serine hydrolase domain-containing protein n=1 Tax=Embleya sp. NPDC005971 TaxID=3156724 RepID=UPI0033DCA3B6
MTDPATSLHELLKSHVDSGPLPGAVALVARHNRVAVQAVGSLDAAGTTPMTRDTIFRIASLTKPIIAAAVMLLVEDGRFALGDPVGRWLPELAAPYAVRSPTGPIEDVVPVTRPITVFDLLTFRAGYGFPSDFSLPAVGPLFTELTQGPPQPQLVPAPDKWLARLARIPLLYQPGEAWLYNTCSDILGVLIARVSGRSLPDFLADRLFEPLGMVDTGFAVPRGRLDRFAYCYRGTSTGGLDLVDPPAGQWSSPPAFPSGAGGLVSTVDDCHAFARLLLGEGTVDGRQVLTPASVRRMTTDHLTAPQRDAAHLFLEGQGWGFGGSVDVAAVDPWNVPGRYGWVGGTGTAAHIVPSTGTATILLTQFEMSGPTPPTLMRDFWHLAAGL